MTNVGTNNPQPTTQFFSIENSSNPVLGNQIRQEIDTLANHFIKLDDQEKSIKRDKKSIILELADKFERLHEIGEYPLPINTICASLYRYLQRKGFSVDDSYIRKVCSENAPQYLNTSYQERYNSAIDIKIYQDEIMAASDKTHNIKLELMKRDQIQELISKQYEIIDKLHDYADANNITVEPVGIAEEPNYDSSELDPFKDSIITDKPESRPSDLAESTILFGQAMQDCGKTIEANGKMMRDYPPAKEDLELEVKGSQRMLECRDFFLALSRALKNGTDRKYRRSILQWMKIAQDEQDWGKHASSSKNPYLAKFRDPKTGEWKEEIRKLTREQIGDVSPKIRDFSSFFKKTFPAFLDFIRWSEIYLHPFTNGESVKLGPKLSDRSLR